MHACTPKMPRTWRCTYKKRRYPQECCQYCMADWFHPPEIKEIDISDWHGQIGQTIRVQAIDDVQVKQVNVMITDENDVILEQGVAMAEEGGWWTYRTTAAATGNRRYWCRRRTCPGTSRISEKPELAVPKHRP